MTTALGAQGTVIGGGRYDGLIGSMGGPETPAVGWAGGIERLAMLVEAPEAFGPIAIVPNGPDNEAVARELAVKLRLAGHAVDMAYRGNAKRRVELARKVQARAVIHIRTPDAETPEFHLTPLIDTLDAQSIRVAVYEALGRASFTGTASE